MEDQEREAAIDAEQHDELDLCLGLRLFPSRLNLQISSPKVPAQKSPHLSIPIWGHGGSRSQQEPDRKKREDKRKSEANVSNEKRRALERESDFSERPNGHTIGIGVDVAATPFFVRSSSGFDSFQPVIGGGSVSNCCSKEGSTGVSDYQSTSGSQDAGGSSSDDGSYFGHSRTLNHTNNKDCSPSSSDKQIRTSHHDSEPSTPQPNGSTPGNSSKGKPDCSFSTDQTELSQTVKEVSIPMKTTSTSSQMNPCYLNRNSNVQAKIHSPSKAVEIGRPPKPEAQPTHKAMTQMPCVATTGNGPNGKRITGFLYKYNKLEVSIVCVCHGTTFSPAGFVEHAGGVGIENPLRHITIAPSVFK